MPNLPRKDQTIRDYKMSPAQQAQYNQMEYSILAGYRTGADTACASEVAIVKYAKLAQIQTGFIYDEERIVHELVTPEENPRLKLLKQILEEEVEGKCCVVYRHRAILPVLIRAFAEYDPAWIKGQMKPEECRGAKNRSEQATCNVPRHLPTVRCVQVRR